MSYSGYSFNTRQASSKVASPEDPCAAWLNQEAHWGLIEDLIAGSYEIRRRHRRYLPQEPRETDESYDNRLAR